MATVIWSEKSVSDLEEIFDYIAIGLSILCAASGREDCRFCGTAIDLSDLWSFSS